jgi:NHL repeat
MRNQTLELAVLLLGLPAASVSLAQSPPYVFTTIAGLAGVHGTNDGANSDARFYSPSELTLDRDGVVYVSDFLNHAIRKITPMGTNWLVSTVAGLPGSLGSTDGTNSDARFNRPVGLKFDQSGNLFVADLYNDTIRKLAPVGTNWVVTTIAGLAGAHGESDGTNSDARFWGPRGLAVDNSNRIYVTDSANFTIRGITPSGTNWVVSTLAGQALSFGFADGTNESAQFDTPFGIAVDSSNTLFVADWGNNAVRQIAAAGPDWVTTTIAGFFGAIGTTDGPGSRAMFNSPAGIAVDASHNIYLTDQYNHTIRKLTPGSQDWVVSTVGGAPLQPGSAGGTGADARFNLPWGIAVDGAGNLFIADSHNYTIRKGTPLVLRILATPNQIVLSWPAGATNFVLETAGVLVPAPSWAALTNGLVVLGDTCFVTNSLTGPAAFYRLHKQ